MKFLKFSGIHRVSGHVVLLSLIVLTGCGSIFNKEKPEFLARVGESYLYREDIAHLLPNGVSKGDSASFVTNYINNWASKQLLLSKAKINLPEEKLAEYDELVSDYRADLYTRAYKEALVRQGSDTLISPSQLKAFYESEKENFKLKEKVVQLRFVELPKQFLNKKTVTDKLKRFKEDDREYLDSIGVQFRKLNFNDSLWVSASRVVEEIPPLTFENADKHLKKSQFFELEDDNGVYLAKIVDVKNENDIAPLSYIEPRIKQVLLSRRKLNFLRKLETEILDEAIKKNEFEIYAKDE
ncbi:peptidyl-prolyl cis-trans isomerase [Pseudozobellia sp. WGM2]|uniref:peptidyl-prolyl cis-trans isomerase n=1 Tax=Pseudozobellia sp. WGM2 TaxID=2787625 RepID=UPI001ADF8BE3|nr:peptidyl-prolyl cis-trans isomerase [Pseudozobellia sp. WGM2]